MRKPSGRFYVIITLQSYLLRSSQSWEVILDISPSKIIPSIIVVIVSQCVWLSEHHITWNHGNVSIISWIIKF